MNDANQPPVDNNKAEKHRRAMEKQKQRVDETVANANIERGIAVLLTGNGKGKTTSAFGMVLRALGYGQKVAVVQFIKGQQLSGEEIYLRDYCPHVAFYQMATGFTWDTQNRDSDIAAAKLTWEKARQHLQDASIDLVVLDEITYMLAYAYLNEDDIVNTIQQRPPQQSVVVTGRGGGARLRACMDTVSEIKDVKHAYTAGIKARRGVDY